MKKKNTIIRKATALIASLTIMFSAAAVGAAVYPQLSTPVFAASAAVSEKSTLINMPEELSAGTINEYFLSPDGKKIFYISENDKLNGRKDCLKCFDPSTGKVTTKAVFSTGSYICVANGKVYVIDDVYGKSYRCELTVYNIKTDKTERHITLPEKYGKTDSGNQALVLGVDSKENLIIASNASKTIFYTDKNGNTLSTVKYTDDIYSFAGMDNGTGSFFVKGTKGWTYWGYPRTMAVVRMGNVSGNKITFNNGFIDVEAQLGSDTSYAQSEILGGRYLSVSSNFGSYVALYDLKKLKASRKLTENITTAFTASGQQYFVTSELEPAFKVGRNSSWDYSDSNMYAKPYGSRTVVLDNYSSVITASSDRTLTEYSLDGCRELFSLDTKYPIVSLLPYNGGVAAIERWEGKFYFEAFPWKHPTSLTVVGKAKNMTVGSSSKLSAKTDGSFKEEIEWTSSDPTIASVSRSGEVHAMRVGTTTVTAVDSIGLKASYQVTVTKDRASMSDGACIHTSSGAMTKKNSSENDYRTSSKVVNSYIMENSDGSISLAEAAGDTVNILKTKDNGKTYNKAVSVKMELPIFGGLYSGDTYNFMVFGSKNEAESSKAEVVRIVKYSKSWKRISALSLKDINTQYPFYAGSLRMTEKNGMLYIHTCHQMISDENGVNHQANMTFMVNENDMSLRDSSADVENITTGYVSHSFNQFIAADDKYIFRVDHGDISPRGVSLVRSKLLSISGIRYTIPLMFDKGSISNYTGASVGGLALSDETCIIAGNCFDVGARDPDVYSKRNIFVTVSDKELTDSRLVWLTSYKDSDKVTVSTPQIVRFGSNSFLVMWEENREGTVAARMVTIDSEDNKTSGIYTTKAALSDCQPVLCSDGLIRFYTVKDKTSLYCIDPYKLSEVSYRVDTSKITMSKTCIALGQKVRVSFGTDKGMPELIGALRVRRSNSSKWYTISDFKSRTSATFKPAKAVKYEVIAKVRNADGTITRKRFWLNVVEPLKNTSTLSASSIKAGSKVTVSLKSSGGLGTVRTAIHYKRAADTSWTRLQSYSTNSSKVFTPKAKGKYTVRVSVKDERGVVVKKDLTLNVT